MYKHGEKQWSVCGNKYATRPSIYRIWASSVRRLFNEEEEKEKKTRSVELKMFQIYLWVVLSMRSVRCKPLHKHKYAYNLHGTRSMNMRGSVCDSTICNASSTLCQLSKRSDSVSWQAVERNCFYTHLARADVAAHSSVSAQVSGGHPAVSVSVSTQYTITFLARCACRRLNWLLLKLIFEYIFFFCSSLVGSPSGL